MRQAVSHLASSLVSGRFSFTLSSVRARTWDRRRKAAALLLLLSSSRGLDSRRRAVYGMLSERSINKHLFSSGCGESKSEECGRWRVKFSVRRRSRVFSSVTKIGSNRNGRQWPKLPLSCFSKKDFTVRRHVTSRDRQGSALALRSPISRTKKKFSSTSSAKSRSALKNSWSAS